MTKTFFLSGANDWLKLVEFTCKNNFAAEKLFCKDIYTVWPP